LSESRAGNAYPFCAAVIHFLREMDWPRTAKGRQKSPPRARRPRRWDLLLDQLKR
jgi:hypothetical protein